MLFVTPPGVLIEVRDADPQPPQTRATNDDGASDGTDGVLLVAALSTRRVPRARPKPQAELVADLDILRRLRDHLMS